MSKSKRRGERKEEAAIRQRLAIERSPEEQLARLDEKFGAGCGAQRERQKLQKKIDGIMQARQLNKSTADLAKKFKK